MASATGPGRPGFAAPTPPVGPSPISANSIPVVPAQTAKKAMGHLSNHTGRVPRGKALLIDHLPIQFLQSSQGTLLIIYNNGDACFYPVNDQAKQPNSSNVIKILGKESSQPAARPKLSADPKNSAAASKYFAYDISHQEQEIYTAHRFPFRTEDNGERIIPPRKLELSHDKRLLLINGVVHRGFSCVVVYQISPTPDYFKLVYYDLSMTFLDACFSPDSTRLVVIPAKHPTQLSILSLPLDYQKRYSAGGCSFVPGGVGPQPPLSSIGNMKTISFEPRVLGPLAFLGPARGIFGQPHRMTRVAASCLNTSADAFQLISWNDDSTSEYVIWTVRKEAGAETSLETAFTYEWLPRLLLSRALVERSWLESEESPKTYILDVQFCPGEPSRAMFVVKRSRYPKPVDNGIGLQTLRIDPFEVRQLDEEAKYDGIWYRIREQDDKINDEKDILCARWTRTLLLGTAWAASAISKGKGLYELVDSKFGSAFQALYDPFVQTVCNFVQVGDFRRFWVNMTNGGLSEITIAPQQPSPHPEWRDLFQKEPIDWNMRGLGRCVGYFINDISKETSPYEVPAAGRSKMLAKKSLSSKEISDLLSLLKGGEAHMEKLYGLHLYRCWVCRRVLLKPLQCAQCLSVTYCSKECQKEHWQAHKALCLQIRDKLIQNKK
jgi:hypothetical protein